MRADLPRQKQQTILRKIRPESYFDIIDLDDKVKIILIIPNRHRSFIYQNKKKSLYEGQEQLATDYLMNNKGG